MNRDHKCVSTRLRRWEELAMNARAQRLNELPMTPQRWNTIVWPQKMRFGLCVITTQPPNDPTTDPVSDFLARPHPRPLKGPWLAGWALDFHSRFDGARHLRSTLGDLVFRYKYDGERELASDLAVRWAELLAAHPELPKPDAIIPIPPSTPRAFDPVTLLA